MLTASPTFAAPVKTAAGNVVIHPRYRAWLGKCGLNSASSILGLRGEVVGGHADRYVVRVSISSGVSGRIAFLKREHVRAVRSRFRNWLDGFGWISRCEREAAVLQKLEDLGLAAPQWLAHGEDAQGRAFLLVDNVAGAAPLLDSLTEYRLQDEDRRLLAERIGRFLAECHAAKIGTPDVAAKHILVQPKSWLPTFLDWQSAKLTRTISDSEITAWLGALDASLPLDAVAVRERLRVLWAYRRCAKESRAVRFGGFARAIRALAQKKQSRSRIQLQHISNAEQRLIWLDGESLVAVPEAAENWPADFDHQGGTVTLRDGTIGRVIRFRSSAMLPRILAKLRERPWRAPGTVAARLLFHLQRHGIAAPKLLAFGQRTVALGRVDSFMVVESAEPPNRDSSELGRFLRKLHNARCRFTRAFLDSGFDDIQSVRLVRRLSESQKRADLARALSGWDRFDKMKLLQSYLGAESTGPSTWDQFARAIL